MIKQAIRIFIISLFMSIPVLWLLTRDNILPSEETIYLIFGLIAGFLWSTDK